MNKTLITRGDILMDMNSGEMYELVRGSGGPRSTTAGYMYGFNLRNVSTGKMRVSVADRVLWHNAKRTVSLADLNRHFGRTSSGERGLRLVYLTDTKTIAPAVKKAIAAEIAPTPAQVGVWSNLGVLPSRLAHAYAFSV